MRVPQTTMQVWAAGKLQAGWRFAPERATTNAGGTGGGGSRERSGAAARKTLSTLVPYEHLTAKEKASSRNSALEMVRTLLYLGFTFESLNNKAVQQRVDALRTRMSDMALAAMRVKDGAPCRRDPHFPRSNSPLSSMPPRIVCNSLGWTCSVRSSMVLPTRSSLRLLAMARPLS